MEQSTLQMILDKQKEFQEKMGYDEFSSIEKIAALIHTHGNFAIEEIIEMLREMPFHKPWKEYPWGPEKMNEQFNKVEEEWMDAIIFLMNIAVFLGFNDEKINRLYLEKLGVNNARQEDPSLGYVTGGVK